MVTVKSRLATNGTLDPDPSLLMALPPQLRTSTTPHELEFIANEELIEIVPLFSMDRIRLLSVSTSSIQWQLYPRLSFNPQGNIRATQAAYESQSSIVDGC